LQSLYGYTKFDVVSGLNALIQFSGLSIQHPTLAHIATDVLQTSNADFADILLGLLAQNEGGDYVLTFDKKASKLATHRSLA
jgi:predicted nucleic-acid-binding protein